MVGRTKIDYNSKILIVPIKIDYTWSCCTVNGVQRDVHVIFMQLEGLVLIKKI